MDTVFSSPAIGSDGTLYFGSNGESGNPDRFFAVNQDATQKWDFTDVFSSPAIGADGTIYFGTGNQLLYALNAITPLHEENRDEP